MSVKRQPSGIPTGGEFAANAHDEASASLAPGVVKLENGWTSIKKQVAAQHGTKSAPDYIVQNPEGTAKYTIFRDGNHDVRVHLDDLETGFSGSFRSFAPGGGVNALADDHGVTRIYQAPRLGATRELEKIADFSKFPGDSQFIDGLARESLMSDEFVRVSQPMSARHVRVGDVIDFEPIVVDREAFPEEPDGSVVDAAQYEGFAVTEVEQDPTGITLHTTETTWHFPREYQVRVMTVIDDYKTADDHTFPEEQS